MSNFYSKVLSIRDKGKELITERNEKKLYNYFVDYINKNKITNSEERLDKMLEIYIDKIDIFKNNKSIKFKYVLKENKDIKENKDEKIELEEGLYICKYCKSNKTFHSSVQTRSSDEGMTIYVHCSECFKMFVIS